MTTRDSADDTGPPVTSDDSGMPPHPCPACETLVPGTAVYCPGCGRGQTEPVPSGAVTASRHWSDVILLGLLAWLGLFMVLAMAPGSPSLPAAVGPVTFVGTLGMALAAHFDMQYVRQRTGWNPDTPLWLIGFTVWFANIPVAALYLWKRRRALRGKTVLVA